MRLSLTPAQADIFTQLAQREGISIRTTVKRTDVRVAFAAESHPALVQAVEVSADDVGYSPATRDALLRKLKAALDKSTEKR